MDKKLFVVTNRKLIKQGDLCSVVSGAVKGGADAIILREKDLSYSELLSLATKLKEVIDEKVPLVINSNYEVAKNMNAGGIHLTYNSFIKFEEYYKGLIGTSVHSLEEAISVNKKGADYFLAGHIFNTACKAGLEGRGLAFLNSIYENVDIPVIAIGGINLNNIKETINAGASGIAIMSSAMEADNPEKLVYEYKARL